MVEGRHGAETVSPAAGRVGTQDLVQVTSILTVSSVKSSDAGVYQCVTSNTVAAVHSTRATVTVSGNYGTCVLLLAALVDVRSAVLHGVMVKVKGVPHLLPYLIV